MQTAGIVTGTGAALLVVSVVASVVKASIPEPPAAAYQPTEKERAERLLAAQRAQQERLEREPIERDRAEQERIRSRNQKHAFGLLKAAAEAAHSGDCTTVILLGDQIRAVDLDVWNGWFLRDVAIKRCLDAGSPPAPVAPEAPPAAATTPVEDAP